MLLKKISAKTLIGDIKQVIEGYKDGENVILFHVFGRANGIKTGTSNFGEWLCFEGQFEAVNVSTGETSQAPKCFLPDPIESMLVNALKDNAVVEFALEVGVKANSKLPMGYEYIVNPLVEVKQSDDLKVLRETSAKRLAKLA